MPVFYIGGNDNKISKELYQRKLANRGQALIAAAVVLIVDAVEEKHNTKITVNLSAEGGSVHSAIMPNGDPMITRAVQMAFDSCLYDKLYKARDALNGI